ncbi:MAG: nucleotide exchange factor GrpE [Candidatus Shikimatogenerans sp. JK-2022]|nr:nucleotide exchange factor GrpE [Candidatus Shikimatogenerans bostrichidophilus]
MKEKKNSNNELNKLKKKCKKKINLLKDKFIRLLADFENYKKRNDLEKKNLFNLNKKKIIKDILPILDDFNRLVKEEKIEKNKGIYLIYKKLKTFLKFYGLKKIKVNIGDSFNSYYHEAILQSKIDDKNMKNKIIKVIENGYYIDNNIIRCAKVIVGI